MADQMHRMEDYRSPFERLMNQGHGWINLSVEGVWNGTLLVSVERPGYEDTVPREFVSVNLSGPSRRDGREPIWDLSGRVKDT
jgi:hypothetical protein